MESVNLRDVIPSVMLTGPSGCGKTTVAMIVARRLNMNVHKVSLHVFITRFLLYPVDITR
jgi:MoxR-like ATPase